MIRNNDVTRTLADLRMAVDLRRPVTIDYESADGARTVRVIEPFEVVAETRKGHPLVRAMDRRSGETRSFRIDRLAAYRVAPHRGTFRIPRPLTAVPAPVKRQDAATWTPATDWDDEWAAFNELQYDPDAPVPYLVTEHYNPEA